MVHVWSINSGERFQGHHGPLVSLFYHISLLTSLLALVATFCKNVIILQLLNMNYFKLGLVVNAFTKNYHLKCIYFLKQVQQGIISMMQSSFSKCLFKMLNIGISAISKNVSEEASLILYYTIPTFNDPRKEGF